MFVCVTAVKMTRCTEIKIFSWAPNSARGDDKLTLVVDEAVGGEQFEGVDLEQDAVEEKVVSGRTELSFMTQARLSELLSRATGPSVTWLCITLCFTDMSTPKLHKPGSFVFTQMGQFADFLRSSFGAYINDMMYFWHSLSWEGLPEIDLHWRWPPWIQHYHRWLGSPVRPSTGTNNMLTYKKAHIGDLFTCVCRLSPLEHRCQRRRCQWRSRLHQLEMTKCNKVCLHAMLFNNCQSVKPHHKITDR